MIRIENGNNGRIIVKFPYNPAYIKKIKTIKGYKWHPEERYWSFQPNDGMLKNSYPHSMEKALILTLLCSLREENLKIYEENWYQENTAQRR